MTESKQAGFLESLRTMSVRLEEIDRLLATPEVAQSSLRLQPLMRERGRLVRYVDPYRAWEETARQRQDAEAMAAESDDAEMRELAQAETDELRQKEEKLLDRLRELVLDSQDRMDAGSL